MKHAEHKKAISIIKKYRAKKKDETVEMVAVIYSFKEKNWKMSHSSGI